MIGLWLCAALLSAASVAFLLAMAQRARNAPAQSDPTLDVYRRHLGEVDALAARGLLPAGEHEAARAEAGRRLLRAADARSGERKAAPNWAAPVLAVLTPLLAAFVYFGLGSPMAPDRPYSVRLAEWRAEPQRLGPAEASAVLAQLVRERPRDAEAHTQLALARLAAGDGFGAVRAAETAATLEPNEARRWTGLARTLLGLEPAQAADARRALARAQAISPDDVDARYWLGRAEIADGDPAGGAAVWRELAGSLPAADPRRAALQAELASLTAPPPDVDAAITAMVEGLAGRLRAEPLDPEGWTRLVRAYAVLGREQEMTAALSEARRLFSGRPEVLRDLDAAAAAGRARSGLRAGG